MVHFFMNIIFFEILFEATKKVWETFETDFQNFDVKFLNPSKNNWLVLSEITLNRFWVCKLRTYISCFSFTIFFMFTIDYKIKSSFSAQRRSSRTCFFSERSFWRQALSVSPLAIVFLLAIRLSCRDLHWLLEIYRSVSVELRNILASSSWYSRVEDLDMTCSLALAKLSTSTFRFSISKREPYLCFAR